MLKIGNTVFKHGLMLAPMAGFSDYAMRRICHELGAEYSVTEMVSAKAVVYKDKKTAALARITREEGPVGLQIFGSEPSVVAEAASILEHGADGGCAPVCIDINMGCPVPKIFNNGEGSALMKKPTLIYDIVKQTSRAVDIPTTVKLRLGVDRDSINIVECAEACQEAGAQAICIHGRTRTQMYSGEADFSEIAKVKSSLHIPVIANGDIVCAADALRVLSQTGADGVAIGRGAVGNPFVFSEISSVFSSSPYYPPDMRDKASAALRQLKYAISDKGEHRAVIEARKQLALYFKSFRGAAELRADINNALTLSEVERALMKINTECE